MTFARNRTPEWMDDPQLDDEDHKRALLGLARLNRLSGVSGAFFTRLVRYAAQVQNRPLRVLDVCSGSGDLPIDWARRAKRTGLAIQITTTDVSGVAVEATQCQARAADVELVSIQRDCLVSGLPRGFDVVTCSLFMHHCDDAQVIRLLQCMRASAGVAVLVSDLDRSWLNLAMISTAARVATRSPIVHHDATASIRGAYTRSEFAALAERALAQPVEVRRLFPCRFMMSVDELAVSVVVPAFA